MTVAPVIATIGVYGFNKDHFFQTLVDAQVDIFCDIRLRRGMRGPTYSFVNSESLQKHLHELGIGYVHVKELAPSQSVREIQHEEDERQNIAKSSRKCLGKNFIQAYEQECLTNFNAKQFIEQLGPEVQVISLFCVEGHPEACHRSLAATKFASQLGLRVKHLRP